MFNGVMFNGVVVRYQDPSGQRKTVGPPGATTDDTDAALADTSPMNPLNAHAVKRWGVLEIASQATTLVAATRLGAAWLAEASGGWGGLSCASLP